jgi:hypothetical protein
LSNTTLLAFKKPIRIANFSPIEKAEAAAYSEGVYDECFESGSLSKEELADYLMEVGLWTQQEEEDYLQGLEDLQQMKVDYFEMFAIETRRMKVKRAIEAKIHQLNAVFQKKVYLNEYTCEYARDEAYAYYLFRDKDYPFAFSRKFLNSRMPEDDIRSLYFDGTWRMIWGVSKDPQSIFGLSANELNDNQLSLLYWSKLYDNISESTDAPGSAVMKDSLAVDGWFIKQAKKREAEDKMKSLPTNDASENFVMVSSAKEAKEINSLNNAEGRQILKSRARDLAAKGELDERQFSHVKQEIGIRKNELSFRGK